MFTSKGAQAYDPELNLTSTILLQGDFDIPALVRITGPTFGAGSIHAFAGPSAGVRLSAKRQLATSDSIGVRYGEKVDMSNEIERFELGFVIGAGVNIGRRFVIDGRYLRGLTSVDTDTADGVNRKKNRRILDHGWWQVLTCGASLLHREDGRTGGLVLGKHEASGTPNQERNPSLTPVLLLKTPGSRNTSRFRAYSLNAGW